MMGVTESDSESSREAVPNLSERSENTAWKQSSTVDSENDKTRSCRALENFDEFQYLR